MIPNPFPLLLTQASTTAASIDLLIAALTVLTAVFTIGIFVAIVFLTVRYRQGARVDRSNAPHEGLAIELVWTIIPTIIAIGFFVWSTVLYFSNVRVPPNAMEIYVVGKQWMWKLQHPEGRWEMNELHVPVGRPVKLTMTSEDVLHSFFVPAFRVKQDVVPGRYSQLWFQARDVGTYHLFCAEFCGTNHSGMIGTVTVMEPGDYEKWLKTGNYEGGLAAAGERQFVLHGCSGCHGKNASVRAPLLDGVYGKPVAIQIPRPGVPIEKVEAETIVADDRYIHDSIVLPEKEVAAGYKPIMPTFKNQLTEAEIVQIIAYLKSLETSNGGSNGSGRGDYSGPITQDDIKARTGFVPSNMTNITRNSMTNPAPAPGSNSSGAATSTPAGAAPPVLNGRKHR